MRKVWITNGIADKEITKLFNASQSTNFTFKIPNWDNKRTIEINSLMNTRRSSDVDKAIFKNNLVMVDSHFPEIIVKMLRVYFSGQATRINKLVAKTCESNPIGYDKAFQHELYTYKVKHFLNIIALGMTPTSVWQRIYDAKGGSLITEENGEFFFKLNFQIRFQ